MQFMWLSRNVIVEYLLDKLRTEVPSAKVRTIEEVYCDRELKDFGVLQENVNSDKKVRIARSPFNSRRKLKRVPELGQDNEIILKSIGYKKREIPEIQTTGVHLTLQKLQRL